jgi:hypothetical protein
MDGSLNSSRFGNPNNNPNNRNNPTREGNVNGVGGVGGYYGGYGGHSGNPNNGFGHGGNHNNGSNYYGGGGGGGYNGGGYNGGRGGGGNYRGGGGGNYRGGGNPNNRGNRQHNYNPLGNGRNSDNANGNGNGNRGGRNGNNQQQQQQQQQQPRVMGSFKPVSATSTTDPLLAQLSSLVSKLHSVFTLSPSSSSSPPSLQLVAHGASNTNEIKANIDKLTNVVVNGAKGRFLKCSSDVPEDDSDDDDDNDEDDDMKDEGDGGGKGKKDKVYNVHDKTWLVSKALKAGRGDTESVRASGFMMPDEEVEGEGAKADAKTGDFTNVITDSFSCEKYYKCAKDNCGILISIIFDSLISLPSGTSTYTSLVLSIISNAKKGNQDTVFIRFITLLHSLLCYTVDNALTCKTSNTNDGYKEGLNAASNAVRCIVMLEYSDAVSSNVLNELLDVVDSVGDWSRKDYLMLIVMQGVIVRIVLGMDVGGICGRIEGIVGRRKGPFEVGRGGVMVEIDEGGSDDEEEEEEEEEITQQYSDNFMGMYRVIKDYKSTGVIDSNDTYYGLWCNKDLLDHFKEELCGTQEDLGEGDYDNTPEFVEFQIITFPKLITPCLIGRGGEGGEGGLGQGINILTKGLITPRYPILTPDSLTSSNKLSSVSKVTKFGSCSIENLILLNLISFRSGFSKGMSPIGDVKNTVCYLYGIASSVGDDEREGVVYKIVETLMTMLLGTGCSVERNNDRVYLMQVLVHLCKMDGNSDSKYVNNCIIGCMGVLVHKLNSISVNSRSVLATFIGYYIVEITPVGEPVDFILFKKISTMLGDGDGADGAAADGARPLKELTCDVIDYVRRYKGDPNSMIFPMSDYKNVMKVYDFYKGAGTGGAIGTGGTANDEDNVNAFVDKCYDILNTRGTCDEILDALLSADVQNDVRSIAFVKCIVKYMSANNCYDTFDFGKYKYAVRGAIEMDVRDGGSTMYEVWGKCFNAFILSVHNCQKWVINKSINDGFFSAHGVVYASVVKEHDYGLEECIRREAGGRDSDLVEEDEDEDDMNDDGGDSKKVDLKKECKEAVLRGLEDIEERLKGLKGEGNRSVIALKGIRRRVIDCGLVYGVLQKEDVKDESASVGYFA